MRKKAILKYINDTDNEHIAKAKEAREAGNQSKCDFEFGAACALGALRMWITLGYLDTKYIEDQKKLKNLTEKLRNLRKKNEKISNG